MASISESSNVTLFTHRVSPYALRVQLALVEKGIPFNPIVVDLQNKPKELLEANPVYGKIPSLVHNGKNVVESVVILEYLEDAWPEKVPLMPKDALAKSKVRFWTDYIYKSFENMQGLSRMKAGPDKDAKIGETQVFIKTLESTMTEYSADGPFFTGDRFGYLDVVLSPLFSWRFVFEMVTTTPLPGPEQSPRLHKWLKAMEAHKSVKETFPSVEEVGEYASMRAKQYAEQAASADAK